MFLGAQLVGFEQLERNIYTVYIYVALIDSYW